MRYKDLYEEGVSHLDGDLHDVIAVLESNENVVLCSPNMGDERLIDYLAYRLSEDTRYSVIYDRYGDMDASDLQSGLMGEEAGVNVVLIPHYFRKARSFMEFFRSISASESFDFLSVISLDYNFLSDPGLYFDVSSQISHVKIRRPLIFEMTKSVIETRRILDGWDVPRSCEREIHSLSGGIVDLADHCCGYIDKFQNLIIEDMIKYPSVAKVLASLNVAFEILDTAHLRQLGYIGSDNSVKSELLQHYIHPPDPRSGFDLPYSLERLFQYLREREDEIVSLEEMHAFLEPDQEYSMWATYKLVSRLRKEIRSRYEIRNVKGKGYILRKSGDSVVLL